MKFLLLIIIAITLVSCGEPKEAIEVEATEQADTISGIESTKIIESKEFVNPNL